MDPISADFGQNKRLLAATSTFLGLLTALGAIGGAYSICRFNQLSPLMAHRVKVRALVLGPIAGAIVSVATLAFFRWDSSDSQKTVLRELFQNDTVWVEGRFLADLDEVTQWWVGLEGRLGSPAAAALAKKGCVDWCTGFPGQSWTCLTSKDPKAVGFAWFGAKEGDSLVGYSLFEKTSGFELVKLTIARGSQKLVPMGSCATLSGAIAQAEPDHQKPLWAVYAIRNIKSFSGE